MRLTFLGVRGSTPAPGSDFVRYGGHTSCVAVSADSDDLPTLILDAGTGIRQVTPLLAGQPFRGSILLTHLHWDHVQGLPFFTSGDRPDARVDVHLPAQDDESAAALLERLMSPPAFPITPDELLGEWTYHAVGSGPVPVPGFEVEAVDVVHKGGRTFGYVVAADGARIAYVPDHAPALGVAEEAIDSMRGVDVLIHDAQMIETERHFADTYAHATLHDAIDFAVRVEARRLVMFHHSPGRTDATIDTFLAPLVDRAAGLDIVFAREGMTLDVRG